MAKRKSISKRLRFHVFHRDKFTCQYCGRNPPSAVLVIDHIIPVSLGGGNENENLITACETCNQGKSDRNLDLVPQSIDITLRAEIDRKEQLEEYNKWLIASRKRDQALLRDIGSYWCDEIKPANEKGKWIPCKPWMTTLATFLKRMPAAKIYEAMDIAIARKSPRKSDDNDAWKYFCGICWSMIREAEEANNASL